MMDKEERLKIMRTKEFNLFWTGFQLGRDMDILNDNNLSENDFAFCHYLTFKELWSKQNGITSETSNKK